MDPIQSDHLKKAILRLLDETFDQVHGYYLDKNTSLFETLAEITAEEASIPVGGKCATLAAQVKHAAFYLEVYENSVRDPNSPDADWDFIWRTISAVDQTEWRAIQEELRSSYDRVLKRIKADMEWRDEEEIGNALAVIAHTAYHLGEIRQALCTIRRSGS